MTDGCPRCGASGVTGRLDVCPRCLLEADLPPVTLGGFLELGDEIGRGGMGRVFRAKDLRLGRTVAVKLLPLTLASQPEFRSRFEQEGQALARLQHPRIVAVHFAGQEEDQPFIVMELVEGKSLAGLLPLPAERAVAVALDVCEALAYAHGQGVVHRDVKPQNVLVGPDGRAKVADFGIAKIVGAPGHTASGEVLGTPHYMAPEALAGAPPDPRMDVYALGAVLYETVTGRPPVGSLDFPAGGLGAVMRKALAPSPGSRFASAGEMARALEALRGRAAEEHAPDEELWLRAVALLHAVATGVALWAVLASLTPRVVKSEDLLPLVALSKKRLPDGSYLTAARFEVGPSFAALGSIVAALAAFGFLRWQWRKSAAPARPERPILEARCVFWVGVAACTLYAVRLGLDRAGVAWATAYIPVLGGFIEVLALYFAWVCVLKAWRAERPLRREPWLWAGVFLALLPPAINLAVELSRWPRSE